MLRGLPTNASCCVPGTKHEGGQLGCVDDCEHSVHRHPLDCVRPDGQVA